MYVEAIRNDDQSLSYNISYSVAIEKLEAERPCKIRMTRENTEAVTSTSTCMLWQVVPADSCTYYKAITNSTGDEHVA